MQSVQWKGDADDHFFRMYGFYLQQTDDLVPGKRLVGHTGWPPPRCRLFTPGFVGGGKGEE